MSLKNDIKRNAKSVSLKLDKLSDALDKKYLRFNNRDLVLVENNNKLEVAVIASAKTRRWIKNHFELDLSSEDYYKFAVTLNGEHAELEPREEKYNNKSYTEYYHNDKEVAPLCDYSNQSKRLFWTIKKFNCLDKYDLNEKLDIVNLFCLQDDIDRELGLLPELNAPDLDM